MIHTIRRNKHGNFEAVLVYDEINYLVDTILSEVPTTFAKAKDDLYESVQNSPPWVVRSVIRHGWFDEVTKLTNYDYLKEATQHE